MLNIIWPIFIIISLSFGVITGNVDKVNNSIFESSKEAITLCINLLGVMCLWSGIINIMQKTSLINYLCNIFSPFMKFLFPNLKKSDKAYESISMNIIANVLGLGNSATPLGIKAMNDLQEKNTKKNTLSNSMIMLIVLNTASLQLIPTTVIAIRTSFNSTNPTKIIVPVWIATISALIAGIITTKILIKKSMHSSK